MFLGSQLPLQLPKHLTQVPSALRDAPGAQVKQMLLFVEEHSTQPLPHWFTHEVPTRVEPLTQLVHCVKFELLHVRQLPRHREQLPPLK